MPHEESLRLRSVKIAHTFGEYSRHYSILDRESLVYFGFIMLALHLKEARPQSKYQNLANPRTLSSTKCHF